MSEPVKPALSAEDWENPADTYGICVEWDGYEHMIAALALDGQPFGFRWEDVERCRGLAVFVGLSDEPGAREFYVPWLGELSDRIEALLRPRKEGE